MSFSRYSWLKTMRALRMGKYALRALTSGGFYRRDDIGILGYRSDGRYCDSVLINEYQLSNAYYGLSDILRRYSGYKRTLAASVEHGVYFGDGDTGEMAKYNLPCVVTLGGFREGSLAGCSKRPVFPIGPYIAYAESALSDEQTSDLRLKLGKTMLVIPAHSVEGVSAAYEDEKFLDYLHRIERQCDVDTVLVCLYFNDVVKFAQRYEEAGFTVVCAGFRTDTTFLSRLRAYFDLSDYVVTNSVGTHIGYALSLGKPVSFFDQEIGFRYSSDKRKRETNPFDGQEALLRNMNTIKDVLRGFHSVIKPEHLEVTEPYWGYGCLRSPGELKMIFVLAQEVLSESASNNASYDVLWKKAIHTISRGSFKDMGTLLSQVRAEDEAAGLVCPKSCRPDKNES